MLNKLFAPGPLITGHKDLEAKDCLKCHDAGKGLPVDKCLACHKNIRSFVENKTGFHGLTKKTCIECHFDHKGRDLDTTLVNTKTFDHNLTGYKLVGGHAKIKCEECHKERRSKMAVRPHDMRFIGVVAKCVKCHRKDDVHFYRNNKWGKEDCGKCHGVEKWTTDIKFDHTRDAHFKLEGHHEKMKCAECHVPKAKEKNYTSRYHWDGLKQKQCLSCHQDVHKNNLSKKFQNGNCTKCHNQEKWKIPNFDHKVTNYPLRGQHAELQCTECHKQNATQKKMGVKSYKWAGLRSNCLSCHDDFHAFSTYKVSQKKMNLTNCLNCHNETKWKTTHDFDHNKDTHYVIDGKHMSLACTECHTPTKQKAAKPKNIVTERKYRWSALNTKTCENCHKSPHKDAFSKTFLQKKCTECHVTSSWKDKPGKKGARFNHDETRFKLTGKHSEINCNECHVINKKQVFKFASDKKEFCIDCHKNPHGQQFHNKFSEQSCIECHTTRDFEKLKDFDHSKTQFDLRGQHMKLNCVDCHTAERKETDAKKRTIVWHKYLFKDLESKSCNTCHEDYHKGQLSLQCQKCHNEEKWKSIKFDHNKDSEFPLRGKHEKLKCSECHKPEKGVVSIFAKKRYRVIHFKPINSQCITCHRDDDIHKGQYGDRCNECHSEKSWELTKDFHRNFTLQGVHYTLKCNECHINDRRLGGMSDNCILCHQKDDIHNGTLPNCKDCHTQHFWEFTTFRHSMTFFPIRGSHRALDCFACHQNGIYQGTPSECIDCHGKDAPAVTHGFPPDAAHTDCKHCHNQFIFH